MDTKYKSNNSITKYGSSPYDMIKCLHIRLVSWNDYPLLNNNTFNEVFIKVTSNPDMYKFWDSYRSSYDDDTPFIFNKDECSDPIKFNTIFYLRSDGTASGYTRFNEVQSTEFINELWIYTHFSYESEISELVLDNSLEVHIYSDYSENLDYQSSYDDYKFTTKKIINSEYIDTFQRFTNFSDHLLSDSRFTVSTSALSILNNGNDINKINIPNVYVPYDNVSIGIREDDLVVCSWNEYSYNITSLSKKSGNDYIVYHSGNIRTSTSSGGYGLKDYSIRRVTPYCIVCYVTVDPSLESAVICLDDNSIRSKSMYESFVNNPYSVRRGYVINNSKSSSLSLKDRIESPELFWSLRSVVNDENLRYLVRIEGSFFVFENENKFYYKGTEGTLLSSRDDLMIFNDCCLLDQTEDSLNFYFVDNNSYMDDSSLDNKSSYLLYNISKDDIRNDLISSIRRNKISYDKIPDIKCSYGGLLFYRDQDKRLSIL